MVTLEKLVADLESLGIAKGDHLLVHSSLSNLGWIEGGAEIVIEALLSAVGPEGTVAVPTLTGSQELGPDTPPIFDPANTPCRTGIIPETLRKRPDAVRSLHPTHSVAALGPKACELVKGHEKAPAPCGPGTPYYRLGAWGGKILFLGVDLRVNTTYHGLEEEWGAPGHLQKEPVAAQIFIGGAWHLQKTVIHQYGIPRDFLKTVPLLKAAGILKEGKVGEGDSYLVETGPMLELIGKEMEADPLFLYA